MDVVGQRGDEAVEVAHGLCLHVVEHYLQVAPQDGIGLHRQALLHLCPRLVGIDDGHGSPPLLCARGTPASSQYWHSPQPLGQAGQG